MRRSVRRFSFRAYAIGAVYIMLFGCGGGGESNTREVAPQPPTAPPQAPTVATCSVSVAEAPYELVWPRDTWETRSAESQGLCPDDLEDASNYAFATGNTTGAVLIIKNGYIVFERYAADRDRTDLVTSWSVGKIVTSMLIGIALSEERIASRAQSVSRFVSAWNTDSRADITVDHIMTLRTALTEPDAGDLYRASNQLDLTINRELVGTPGEKHVSYSNADVMVAGEVLKQATGIGAQAYLNLHVGGSIGFAGEWWVDDHGNFMTYCCLDSTPRDFARFGLLYVRDGAWIEDQIVPQAWVTYSTTPALDEATYLYYWWPVARGGFGAFGLHGQMVVIYPELDLLVLRFSRYVRRGDGRAVKTSTNFHETQLPENFDNGTFLALARAAVPS